MKFPYHLLDEVRDRGRQRVSGPTFASGRRGEDLVHRYVQGCGWTVIARNWRPRPGGSEVDLIAWDGEAVVFIEVKSRATEAYGSPDRAVDEQKRLQIVRTAREYTRRAKIPWKNARFDIASVVFTPQPRVELIRDAYRVEPRLS